MKKLLPILIGAIFLSVWYFYRDIIPLGNLFGIVGIMVFGKGIIDILKK